MAINQVCGGGNYSGGDFYVYYTKEDDKYTMPRIAIRMNGKTNIGEIRGKRWYIWIDLLSVYFK